MSLALIKLSTWSINSHSLEGVLLVNSAISWDRGHTPPSSDTKFIFSSWSFVVMHSLLNINKYVFRPSSSPYLMVRRYAAGCLLLRLAINYMRNRRASSSKLFMDLGIRDPNHTLAGPLKVSEKALQATSLGKQCRVMWALKVSRCSRGSLVPSYIFMRGTHNLGGSNMAIMSAFYGEPVLVSGWSTDDDVPIFLPSLHIFL